MDLYEDLTRKLICNECGEDDSVRHDCAAGAGQQCHCEPRIRKTSDPAFSWDWVHCHCCKTCRDLEIVGVGKNKFKRIRKQLSKQGIDVSADEAGDCCCYICAKDLHITFRRRCEDKEVVISDISIDRIHIRVSATCEEVRDRY